MAIGTITPFRPAGTASINAGTISAVAMLAGGGDTDIVTNASSSLAYVRFGPDPSVSASTIDMPVIAQSLVSHVAVELIGGSGAVLLSRGDGAFV